MNVQNVRLNSVNATNQKQNQSNASFKASIGDLENAVQKAELSPEIKMFFQKNIVDSFKSLNEEIVGACYYQLARKNPTPPFKIADIEQSRKFENLDTFIRRGKIGEVSIPKMLKDLLAQSGANEPKVIVLGKEI